MGSSNNPIVMSVIDPADPWTDNTSKYWPLEEHHYAEFLPFALGLKPTTLLYGAPFLSAPPVAPPSAKIEGIA